MRGGMFIMLSALATSVTSLLVAPTPVVHRGLVQQQLRAPVALMKAEDPTVATDNIDVTSAADALKEIKKMDAPSTPLEEQQRRMIEVLMERAGLEPPTDVDASDELKTLKAECAKLEKMVKKEGNALAKVESAKAACERSLVTLPVELARLREATAGLEAQMADLSALSAPLESEASALASKHQTLEAGLAEAEAQLTAQQAAVAQLSAEIAELTSTDADKRTALASTADEIMSLEEREAAAKSKLVPLEETIAQITEARASLVERTTKAERLAKASAEELAALEDSLDGEKRSFMNIRGELKETRVRLGSARRERNRAVQEEDSAIKEMRENEAMAVRLGEEIEELKKDAPALKIRRDQSRATLEEALEASGRFVDSDLSAALGFDAIDESTGGSADAQLVDQRLLETSMRLETSRREVEGRMKVLEEFAATVTDSMGTAAARREEAQMTLEKLAQEQRRASEEMKTTLGAALGMMETMQGEWDDAVRTNANELRQIKATKADATTKQTAAVNALREREIELQAYSEGLGALTDERRSIAEEEERVRRRYAQLRQRRGAKNWSAPAGPGAMNIDLANLDEVAEEASKSAKEAAIGLMQIGKSMFGKSKKALGQADDTK